MFTARSYWGGGERVIFINAKYRMLVDAAAFAKSRAVG